MSGRVERRHARPRPRSTRRLRRLLVALALVVATACTAGDAAGTGPDPSTPRPEGGTAEAVPTPAEAPSTPGTGAGQVGADRPTAAAVRTDLEEQLARAVEGFPGVQAVLVAQGGRLVAEYEPGGGGTYNVYSVTKSVVSMLAGIAIGDGDLALDTRLGDVLPPAVLDGADPRAADMTVEDLLTMTAGLPDDLTLSPPPVTGGWISHALAQPLGPAGRFVYSSTTSHVLAAVVAAATGEDLLSFGRERLFGPLGIDTDDAYTPVQRGVLPGAADQEAYAAAGFAWPTDPDGLHLGYCCLKLAPGDLLALGQLMLDEGRWDGEQLVPADYVAAATRPAAGGMYGYHWWVDEQAGHASFYASGFGGQIVEVVPDLDLVVVVVSSGLGGTGSRSLVADTVVPALEAAAPPREGR